MYLSLSEYYLKNVQYKFMTKKRCFSSSISPLLLVQNLVKCMQTYAEAKESGIWSILFIEKLKLGKERKLKIRRSKGFRGKLENCVVRAVWEGRERKSILSEKCRCL